MISLNLPRMVNQIYFSLPSSIFSGMTCLLYPPKCDLFFSIKLIGFSYGLIENTQIQLMASFWKFLQTSLYDFFKIRFGFMAIILGQIQFFILFVASFRFYSEIKVENMSGILPQKSFRVKLYPLTRKCGKSLIKFLSSWHHKNKIISNNIMKISK